MTLCNPFFTHTKCNWIHSTQRVMLLLNDWNNLWMNILSYVYASRNETCWNIPISFFTISKRENYIKILLKFWKKRKMKTKQQFPTENAIAMPLKSICKLNKTAFVHWLQIVLILYLVSYMDLTPSRDHQYY